MWLKLLILFLLLQIPLGILVGRFIKLGNASAEEPISWRKKAYERIGRLARFVPRSFRPEQPGGQQQ
jgi:hypothetical protein